MARYFFGSRPRGRSWWLAGRNWIYILLVLVVLALLYGVYRMKAHNRAQEAVPGGQVSQQEIAPQLQGPAQGEYVMSPALEVTAEADPKVAELISQAIALADARPPRIIEARDRLNELLPIPMSAEQRVFIKEQLGKLAQQWLFSRKIFPQDRLCERLHIKPGAILSSIGREHKVPHEILMDINGIVRAESLQAGDIIKVINGPFHARVHRSVFTIDLYLQNTYVCSFPVGLGQPGRETPTGLWLAKVGGKLIKPAWTDPDTGKTYQPQDPDYPLGSRWIGLEGIEGQAKDRTGFAIHGTKNPEQIGTLGSKGCVRLHNGDVILVYNLLMPGFSKVEIVD